MQLGTGELIPTSSASTALSSAEGQTFLGVLGSVGGTPGTRTRMWPFLFALGSFLLTVKLLILTVFCFGVFLLTVGAFLLTIGASLLTHLH